MHMDRKRKAAADEGTLKTQRHLPRQHRDRERRALESVEAGTIQQSPLPSVEQPWVQEFPAAIEEVYHVAMCVWMWPGACACVCEYLLAPTMPLISRV